MTNKPQHGVKPGDQIPNERLAITHYVWIALALLAAMAIEALDGTRAEVAAFCGLALAPAAAGLWLIHRNKQADFLLGEALLISAWTALAAIGIAATGGLGSPLTILFALGPLTAFAFGRERLAVESAAFGAAALGLIMLLDWIGALPAGRLNRLALPVAGIGVLQTLVLIWAAFARKPEQADASADVAPAPPPPPPPPIIPQVDPELDALRARAEAAEHALISRTSYFASLGHDLRTPLNAIMGYAQMLQMNMGGGLSEKQVDQAGIINESGQDLLLLVDDMMDLAKAEADRQTLDLEPVDLGASGKSIMAQTQAIADRKQVKLNLRTYGEPWAKADARAVRQIWQNLISNAIKYSEAGGTVTLSASDRKDGAVLSVKDTGAGMDEDDLARIAKPFEMGANSKGVKGTGLGMTIVKTFADLHGADVVIDTAPGDGTRFQVIFQKADADDLDPL